MLMRFGPTASSTPLLSDPGRTGGPGSRRWMPTGTVMSCTSSSACRGCSPTRPEEAVVDLGSEGGIDVIPLRPTHRAQRQGVRARHD